MKKFFNLLNIFQNRRQSASTLIDALLKAVRMSSLERALAELNDWRHIIPATAKQEGIAKDALMDKISKILDVPLISGIEPQGFNAGAKINIKLCKKLAVCPILKNGEVTGVACLDPKNIEKINPSWRKLPVYLADWEVIENGLLEVEKAVATGNCSSTSSENICSKILMLILDEVRKTGSNSVSFEFRSNAIIYSYTVKDGVRMQGKISSTVSSRLLRHFRDLANNPVKLEDGTIPRVTFQQGRFINVSVSWDSTSEGASQDTNKPQNRDDNGSAISSENVDVVLVEDNKTFSSLLKDFLESKGLKLKAYTDSEIALKELSSGNIKYRIIICDLHMPKITGTELIERLDAKAPCIMLTSDDDVDNEIKAIKAGVDVFLRKDQDPRLLYAHIDRIFEKEGCSISGEQINSVSNAVSQEQLK